MKLIIIFLIIFVYKLIRNSSYFFKTKRFSKIYKEYILEDNDEIYSHRSEIIGLFKKADVSDGAIPTVKPMGYGQLASYNVSIFNNFPSTMSNQVGHTMRMFDEAIGVYKLRLKQSFSPLYWFEQLVFLPKNLLIYMDFDLDKASFKIINVLLTFIWWIIVFLFTLFRNDFKVIILKMVEDILS